MRRGKPRTLDGAQGCAAVLTSDYRAMLRYALKSAAVGAVLLAALGFAYVSWELHNFQPPAGAPVDDPRLTLISHTIFWAVIGAILGSIFGVVIGVIKRPR